MLRLLILLLITSFYVSAQNTTATPSNNQVRPLECYMADADRQNLAVSTAFATAFYAIGFRTIPPIVKMLNTLFKDKREDPETGAFVGGILSGLEAMDKPTSGLIPATQVLSVLSFLVPLFWAYKSDLSSAECEYAQAYQNSPNTTKSLECYRADGYQSFFSFAAIYSWCLWTGVYVVLPIVASMISKCMKNTGEAPVSPPSTATTPSAEGAIAIDMQQAAPPTPQADSPHNNAQETDSKSCCSAFGDAFKTAMIEPEKYVLINAAQLTPIITFGVMLFGWYQWSPEQERCNYLSQNFTRGN